jgi:hypothetical protein
MTKQKLMKITRNIALAGLCIQLLLTSGCLNPNGTVNNTGTGAVIGGTVGAISGALLGGRHAGEGALIGGIAGLIAGSLVGNAIDRQQQMYLQQQYPQTWHTIQHNDAVIQHQQQQAPPPPPAPPAASPQLPQQTPPPAQDSSVIPLTLADIKALTAAGVRPDVISKEIDVSQSRFTAQDIASAQQSNPPIDTSVIQSMKNHSG